MGGDNVEQLRYGLCLMKAVVTLFVVSVVVLLCMRFLRCIPCNRVKRLAARKAANLDPGDIKRRIG